jgi:hypothetical protein
MAQIPTYEQWMKDTYSLTAKRSEFLLKLDAAIKVSPPDPKAIKEALDRWKFEQAKVGKDWRKSVRNSKGAVTNLYRAVNDRTTLTDQEREAMRHIARMQVLALQKQFLGKKLTFKGSTLIGMAEGAGGKMERLKAGVGHLNSAQGVVGKLKTNVTDLAEKGGNAAAASGELKTKILELCKALCPGLNPNDVLKTLKLGNVETFAANLAPLLGTISSGGKAISGWVGVAKTAWTKSGAAESRYAFAAGDPEAALDAVLKLLNRELASKTAKASVATGAFTGKLLGTFADGGAITGPVLGILETLAEIFQTIVEFVTDYKEIQLANELLRVGALNLELFEICPILGCYFLVIQDHSTIINIAVGEYGTPDFVFDAERLIDKIRPVLAQARQYILVSRSEILGLEKAKGIATENWSVKGKFDKLTDLPGHMTELMGDKIESWLTTPEKPVVVDKSRIVGIGYNTERLI